MDKDTIDRFWSKVDKTSNTNGCWEYQGLQHPFGYGRFTNKGRTYLAHRLSFILHNGEITSKDILLHACDNPKCVNPNHLSVGTRSLNAQDRTQKGRSVRGEQISNSRFTDQDILAIRSSTDSISKIAKQYQTGYGHIWAIRKRILWKHLP